MPIPFILAGLAVAAGAVGVKKGLDAKEKNDEARRVAETAQAIYEAAKDDAMSARKGANNSIQNLGRAKMNVLKSEMRQFVNTYIKINNINFHDSVGIEELRNIHITPESLQQMKKDGDLAFELASASSGVALGGLAALGAYGGTMTFGAASTGTAIASLSGVAATNATLAFLGGGSLAAGGFGMAGGMAVLGGLVAGPALAVMGVFANSKAEENLANAKSNMAKAREIREELRIVSTKCNAIKDRADMFTQLLDNQLTPLFGSLVRQMKDVINGAGTDFRQYSVQDKQIVARTAAVAKAVKAVIDTPILTKDGNLTDESHTVYYDMKSLVPQLSQG